MTEEAQDNETRTVRSPQESVRKLKDGSYKILHRPFRKWAWWKPKTTVPTIQWHPDTGITRYEFERRQTPTHQSDFFKVLRQEFDRRSPMPPVPKDLITEEDLITLPTGLTGPNKAAMKRIDEYNIHMWDPSRQWSFTISSEDRYGQICDILTIAATDYITVPDYNLLVRSRAWLFEDARMVYLMWPGQSAEHDVLQNYTNERPNSLWLVAPQEPVLD